MKRKYVFTALAAVAIAGFGAWTFMHDSGGAAGGEGGKPGKGGKGARGGQGPAIVNVVLPQRQDVPVVLQASGTVVPVSSVELHPQTTSTISKVHIREGQFVKAGEILFSLDERSQSANVDKARAQLGRDQASLADLERQYKRSEELFAQKFIARSALDTLKSQLEAARAGIGAGKASVQAERVAESYATIRAPFAGRVGAINVFPGSLVQPSSLLTSVTVLDPVNLAFTVPEAGLAALLAAQHAGPVAVEASTEDGQPVQGKLVFIDNTVDPQAGAIRVKAQFGNRDTRLWPGQYATARLTLRTLKNALVIPQAAIITGTGGTMVYVMTAEGSARAVPVTRLHAFGTSAAVSGLSGDEQVITEGKQNLRPGAQVRVAGARHEGQAAGSMAASR